MTVHSHYREITAETPYEMGMALGRAFGEALQPFLKELVQLPKGAQDYLTACLTLTREHFPDYIKELEGYAAGAGVGMDIFWQMLLEDDIHELPQEKCTSLVTNNGRLIGHNEDWDAAAANRLFVLRRKLKGRALFELHYAGTLGGNAISLSSSGAIQMINSLKAMPLDISIPRVPTNIIARYVADSDNIDTAIQRLRQIPRMGGYAHTIINTRQGGKHKLLELSQHDMAVHEILHFPFVHANHYTTDEMLHCDRQLPERSESSRQRYAAATAGAAQQMLPEAVISLLEDTSQGPSNSLMNSRTIAGVIIDLDSRCLWVRLASEPEKQWLKYGLEFL